MATASRQAAPSSAIVTSTRSARSAAVGRQVPAEDGRVLVRARRRAAGRRPRRAGSPRRCRRRRRAPGSSAAATRAPSATVDVPTSPARPPPHRRQPTVGMPAKSAVSRWSEAACRPARERARSASSVGRALDHLRLGRPAAAHRDDDDPRSRAARRARAPVTAVLPIRLPVPITAIDGQRERLERRAGRSGSRGRRTARRRGARGRRARSR